MCGIAGYWGSVDRVAPGRVRRMLAAQRHRGPDGAGVAACGPDVPWRTAFAIDPDSLAVPVDEGINCTLGHNLLAIQDRSPAARQPMIAGDLAITFNGEIYNFVELRAELERDGMRLAGSDGDTPVLLELWRRHGPACLPMLRGMFAIAVYDRRRATLHLARDPFGIKPLYYTASPGSFHFASEIRALHAAGIVRRALHPEFAIASAAAGINAFGEGLTLYEQVRELPSGCRMEVDRTGIQVHRWYALPEPSGTLAGPDMIAQMRRECEASIRLHLRARRRIATCLSGGLDSSTVATLIGQELGSAAREFQTFTICTSGPADSELELASSVAAAAGLNHAIVQPPAMIESDALEMAVAYEVPNHVIGPINQFLLLREIAQSGVTVVLDGQGGDELLSGYPWFVPVLLESIRRSGGDAPAFEAALQRRLPYPAETMATFTRMFHHAQEWVKAFMWQGEFLGWSVDRVLTLDATQYYLYGGGGDWVKFRQREYARAELPYLLRQEDRLGMWFGLECRVPFVDAPLVDLASRIVPAELIRDGYLKHPFRIMLPELPERVRWNTAKRGFWETDRANFPWVEQTGRRLALGSRLLRELFPPLEGAWDSLSFDQHWRLLQLALLERCATRDDLADLRG